MGRKQLEIKKRFLTEIYLDLWKGIGFLLTITLIPYGLALIFSPEIIAEEGRILASIYWLFGIMLVIAFTMLIYALLQEWIRSRWKKAKKEVENERR